jgi:hypothetical protein
MAQINKYANGKIYKITDVGYTKCYIGSTVQPLSVRMAGHKRMFKQYLDGLKNFVSSFSLFEEFGLENCKIELLEECSCENKEQLLQKEGEHIKSATCVNKLVAGRTKQESRRANYLKHQDKRRQYTKEYYSQHKAEIQEYKKDYQQKHRVKLSEAHKDFYKKNKSHIQETQKEYYSQNKDKILEYHKEYNNTHKAELQAKGQRYYLKNKDQITEKRKEKIECSICQASIRKSDIARHQKSNKCQTYNES